MVRIAALALRPPGSAAPRAVDELVLVDGLGVDGDRHAAPHSPRQLLLADAADYAALGLAPLALRENLLLEGSVAALRSGTVLRVGGDALVRLMFACEACGRLDLHGPGLAARTGQRRGVLARVVRGGAVRVGDRVEDLGPLLGAWADDWRARIAAVLALVPPGHMVEYARLAHLAGIQSSYCRAFPRLLRGLDPALAARAVTASAASPLPRWDGAGLYEHTEAPLRRTCAPGLAPAHPAPAPPTPPSA